MTEKKNSDLKKDNEKVGISELFFVCEQETHRIKEVLKNQISLATICKMDF
jgi:hypothetical protein